MREPRVFTQSSVHCFARFIAFVHVVDYQGFRGSHKSTSSLSISVYSALSDRQKWKPDRLPSSVFCTASSYSCSETASAAVCWWWNVSDAWGTTDNYERQKTSKAAQIQNTKETSPPATAHVQVKFDTKNPLREPKTGSSSGGWRYRNVPV